MTGMLFEPGAISLQEEEAAVFRNLPSLIGQTYERSVPGLKSKYTVLGQGPGRTVRARAQREFKLHDGSTYKEDTVGCWPPLIIGVKVRRGGRFKAASRKAVAP